MPAGWAPTAEARFRREGSIRGLALRNLGLPLEAGPLLRRSIELSGAAGVEESVSPVETLTADRLRTKGRTGFPAGACPVSSGGFDLEGEGMA